MNFHIPMELLAFPKLKTWGKNGPADPNSFLPFCLSSTQIHFLHNFLHRWGVGGASAEGAGVAGTDVAASLSHWGLHLGLSWSRSHVQYAMGTIHRGRKTWTVFRRADCGWPSVAKNFRRHSPGALCRWSSAHLAVCLSGPTQFSDVAPLTAHTY